MIKRFTFFSTVVLLLSLVFVPFAGTEMKGQTKIEASPDDPAATEADRKFIRRAYEIAREAVANGNRPTVPCWSMKEKFLQRIEIR